MSGEELRAALERLDLRCDYYTGRDHQSMLDGCAAHKRRRDGEYAEDRWCMPCEVRAALAAPSTPEPSAIDAAHLERQRAWSTDTFGPGPRTGGVLDHIRKELVEIEEDPAGFEWIDVVILALDGAWRAGHEPQTIIDAIVAKQTKNEARTWPDWRTGSPDKAIEHVRAAPSTEPALDVDDLRQRIHAARGHDWPWGECGTCWEDADAYIRIGGYLAAARLAESQP